MSFNLYNATLAKTLNLLRITDYKELQKDTIAIKDIFEKMLPTTEIDVFQSRPKEYTLRTRLTDAERATLYDMEDDAFVVEFRDDTVLIDYVWIEKVETISRDVEHNVAIWHVLLHLVVAPAMGPPPIPYRVLIFGWDTTVQRSGWAMATLLTALDIPYDVVAAGNPVPDLTPYGLVILDDCDTHGAFTADEVTAITYHVETLGRHLIVGADTETGGNLAPVNQIAGIWGCTFGGGLVSNTVDIHAGEGANVLWTVPSKGEYGFPTYPQRNDNSIDPAGVDPTFSEYADIGGGGGQHYIYRTFANDARVVMMGHEGLSVFDFWIMNHLNYTIGLKDHFYREDFENLDDWAVTTQATHSITIVGGTYVRFKSIANFVGAWSLYSSIRYDFDDPITGDFAALVSGRLDQVTSGTMHNLIIDFYDVSDLLVGRWRFHDAWSGSTGRQRVYICDLLKIGAANASSTGNQQYRFSFVRTGDTIHFTCSFNIGTDSFYTLHSGYLSGVCTRDIKYILIRFNQYSGQWNVNEYFDVDTITIFN